MTGGGPEPVDGEAREARHREERGDEDDDDHGLQHGLESTVQAMARSLVVKATAGTDAPERCSQAFTVAAVAAASGVPVSLWLTGEATWLALPGRAEEFELPEAAPLADLLTTVLGSGTVTVCSQCAARRSVSGEDVLPGVRIAGAPVFVQETLADGAQALVY